MNIHEILNKLQQIIPSYWPIGSFVHHNPLKGFEHLHFQDGLYNAQQIFQSDVYMPNEYFLKLFKDRKIDQNILDKNLKYSLKKNNLEQYFEIAKTCLLDISPNLLEIKSQTNILDLEIDSNLVKHLRDKFHFSNIDFWFKHLTKNLTLYELNDIIYDTKISDRIQKNIIEFISRFLDENQTTMQMPNRELGMFKCFKLYENIQSEKDSYQYLQYMLHELNIEDIENYLLAHLLKLHGWAGFIKYRSNNPNYYAQKEHPSSLIDYITICIYYEIKYIKKLPLNNYIELKNYITSTPEKAMMKLLLNKGKLPTKFIDELENKHSFEEVLELYENEQLHIKAKQIELISQYLNNTTLTLVELEKLLSKIKKEEGYIWLKSLEDSYIKTYHTHFQQHNHTIHNDKYKASFTFCLDIRSEGIRLELEQIGEYNTYGMGGFLGIPISFIEFDKAHELIQAPAIVEPTNVIFELPDENYNEYNMKKNVQKTTKKILSDLKNNPYTPYIMVEAIGWIFGINLFGKTFSPIKTNNFFNKFKPEKPKTKYTLNKLGEDEIIYYVNKLYMDIITKVLHKKSNKQYKKVHIKNILNHLLFAEKLNIELDNKTITTLKDEFKITQEDYEYQKRKLSYVGFTLEEKVNYVYSFLTLIGHVENFEHFIFIIGHGSISDNNPFESALDCGACGGNISLPNARLLCMLANDNEVRKTLQHKGIFIPDESYFIPGIHITTTDAIKLYDTDKIKEKDLQTIHEIKKNMIFASKKARQKRAVNLPHAKKENSLFINQMDWSEPRPEWGLAKNMGLYIGPRSSISHVDLQNRFFLHSYDYKTDTNNADLLTSIFDGPLVVGEWINLEHYFSTVDNETFGAGSKVYHNVVSKIGVYNGNYSDLKIGLPKQSVHLEGEAYHEPLRLLTFIEAPLKTVQIALEKSSSKKFIMNEWIRLIIIDTNVKKTYSFENGSFKVI